MATAVPSAVAQLHAESTLVDNELGGKYLTFRLADEQFGLQILKIREIIGLMKITGIPNAPASIRGVINLRGKIVPVMDLRARLGFPATDTTRSTCIIVTEINTSFETIEMGLLVDAVNEVLDIQGDEIEPPPALGDGVDKNLILGMAKAGKDVKILLDIDQVITNMNALNLPADIAVATARQ